MLINPTDYFLTRVVGHRPAAPALRHGCQEGLPSDRSVVLHRSWRCVTEPRDFPWGESRRAGAFRGVAKSDAFQGLGAHRRNDGAEPAELPEREIVVPEEGSIVSGMAGRYATALFELALEQSAVDAVNADLDRFEDLVTGSTDLTRLVRSPVFTADEQTRALTAVLERAGIGGLSAQFLRVVTANRRLFALRDMMRAYRALVARAKGEVTAEVTLADAPGEAHLAAIKEALAGATGKNVKVEVKVDPSIIGGLVVKLGSRMVDSSLRSKLNAIKQAMKEVS
jgi:F-type H+-transporting ATPase subunit delta